VRASLDVQVVPPSERPEVQSLVAEAAEARTDIRSGQAFKKPDVGFGVRLKRDEGNQGAVGVVSIAIPSSMPARNRSLRARRVSAGLSWNGRLSCRSSIGALAPPMRRSRCEAVHRRARGSGCSVD
jgi:hypothetical protein